jgi:preprotein translocase subunit SecD
MPEKTQGVWMRLATDYRVIILVIALLLSIVFLMPSYTNGQFNTNLHFGLDFQGGSYLKLKLINNSSPNTPISDQMLQDTKNIMEMRINQYGLKNAPVNTIRDNQNNAYVLINFAGIPYDQAMNIVGKPGKFEIRIQTQGNNSVTVLDGSDVQGVSPPSSQISGSETAWGVNFMLTKDGEVPAGCQPVRGDHGPGEPLCPDGPGRQRVLLPAAVHRPGE